MNSDAVIKLSDATRQLGIPYQRLFQAVAAGRVPAERTPDGNRWLVRESDLPAIAKTLGVSTDSNNGASTRKARRMKE